MADIAVFWDSAGNRGDWRFVGAGLATGSPISTAILISAFTDRLAAVDDEIPDGSGDPRGWWGDSGEPYQIGSRMWLLRRAKQTDETLQRAYDYLAEAFKWMVEDGVAIGFEIAVKWAARGVLVASVVARLNDGTSVLQELGWNIDGGV